MVAVLLACRIFDGSLYGKLARYLLLILLSGYQCMFIAPYNKTVFALLLATSLSACSFIQPEPYTEGALLAQGQQDRQAALKMAEPISGRLTLDEAMARALKYNLERRTRMMEEAMAFQQLEVDHYDMLPRLVAESGYFWRNNDKISQSRNSETGSLSPSRFVSQERSHRVDTLTFSWNLLDFSSGYYKTRQQANRVLIAGERRRKAMHTLIQDVRSAFWQAVAAQRLRKEVLETIAIAEKALDESRAAEAERLRSPLDALRYQRQIQENLRQLESIDSELSIARIALADLINAPLGQELELAEPQLSDVRNTLKVPVETLEETAMVANADVRERHYDARIARLEARRVLVRLFPNLSFDYAYNYDTDSYLLNNEWRDAGLRLSFNLFNLFTGPEQMRLAEAGVMLADQRRIAMQMATLAKTHLARQQLSNAMQQFERADAIWKIDQRITEHLVNQGVSEMASPLDVVANRTTSILSQVRRYQALSQVQAAEARMQATLGLEPEISSVDETTLPGLVRQIEESRQQWQQLGKEAPAAAPAPVATPGDKT